MSDAKPAPSAPPASLEPFAPADDPISGSLRELLAIFADTLGDVKFPDVDARALGVQAKQVEDTFAEVRRAEAALAEARRRLGEAQELLLQRAQRAAAYARVFADGDVALSARLDAVTLPRARPMKPVVVGAALAATEPPKKRGRPRRVPDAGTTLFAPTAAIPAIAAPVATS